ncbi:WD repeat-containing protein 91 [Mortierella sp. NVP85]|nr:WD repeat-containing protein 91 [Mortierella sp. NVP85]
MNSIQHIDELIKEYLLFRGFTSSYKAFETDCRADKDKGFQACLSRDIRTIGAEKIIEELFASIASMDLTGLLDYWKYLDIRYFSRLDHRFAGSVKKFELCLLRYYLVYALPFSKKPEVDPEFDVFFSKTWLDTFTVSLHNFLSTVFQNMPLPSLLCFNIDRLHRKALQCEVETLQGVIETLRKEVQSNDTEISQLRDQVALKKVSGARRRRATSMVESHLAVNNNGDPKSDPVPKRSGSQSSQISQTNRLAITNARRLRAASDAASHAKSETRSEGSVESLSDEELARTDEPFIIVSQELFLEHQSGITHAKFSCEGSLISSCDAENIVRVWSYSGSSTMPPAKIANTNNILSLAWETRDRYLFLGTDASLVRCFSLESRSIVHEIKTEAQFPRVRYLTYSPVEPILICAVTSSDDSSGAMLSINMKTMTTGHTVILTGGPGEMINAVGFNHNGQLVVTGDVSGMIKIYEIRSLSRIMEWSASSQPILSCTFSFDETSIYSVDSQGQLSQDSVHKPDRRIDTYPLQGFKSSTLSSAMMMATSSSNSTRSAGGSSVRSKPFIRTTSSGAPVNSASVLRKHSEGSVSVLANIATIVTEAGTGQDESASGGGTAATGSLLTQQSTQQGAKASSVKDTSTLTAMNVGPGQLLGWSGDTDHLVMGCGNAGVIVQVRTGKF